jgi:hypothetical protein
VTLHLIRSSRTNVCPRFQLALVGELNGAPRPMKMGTICSPLRYDVAFDFALPSANLRQSAILPGARHVSASKYASEVSSVVPVSTGDTYGIACCRPSFVTVTSRPDT